MSLKNEPYSNLRQKPQHPPSRSTFQAVASWKFANDNITKRNKMDLVKSHSQVVPIQGGFLNLLITSSFSSIYVLCVCACVRGVYVCPTPLA